MAEPTHHRTPPIDVIAFHVEGHGTFLVPLAALAAFRVDDTPFDDEVIDAVGWGWQIPTVRWNTFDIGQANRPIALGPSLTTRLDPALFIGGMGSGPDEPR